MNITLQNKQSGYLMRSSITDIKQNFLDVSEYILNERSPLFRPMLHRKSEQMNQGTSNLINPEITPQVEPIDHDTSNMQMTPFFNKFNFIVEGNLSEEYLLDSSDGFSLEKSTKIRRNKPKYENHKNQFYEILQISQDFVGYQLEPESEYSSDLSEPQSYEYHSSEILKHEYMMVQHTQSRMICEDAYCASSNTEINTQLCEAIEKFTTGHPKHDILKNMKNISKIKEITDEDKLLQIKSFIEKYLIEYENYSYEESWSHLSSDVSIAVKQLQKGIEQTFRKRIGELTFAERRVKMLNYLQKKRNRIWRKKKVNYGSRKKVADGRLRIKGKFVTREKACYELGVQSLQGYSSNQIKHILQQKMMQKTYKLVQ